MFSSLRAQRMNLTAITDEAGVMTRHVADSLAVLPPLERAYTSRGGDVAGISLIDVGSGAGLPGLILAVARPSNQIPLFLDC
jgi:16S rRNA (guanine527-N7)-methyltransferase